VNQKKNYLELSLNLLYLKVSLNLLCLNRFNPR
jgi:hypothetical protein